MRFQDIPHLKEQLAQAERLQETAVAATAALANLAELRAADAEGRVPNRATLLVVANTLLLTCEPMLAVAALEDIAKDVLLRAETKVARLSIEPNEQAADMAQVEQALIERARSTDIDRPAVTTVDVWLPEAEENGQRWYPRADAVIEPAKGSTAGEVVAWDSEKGYVGIDGWTHSREEAKWFPSADVAAMALATRGRGAARCPRPPLACGHGVTT